MNKRLALTYCLPQQRLDYKHGFALSVKRFEKIVGGSHEAVSFLSGMLEGANPSHHQHGWGLIMDEPI
jgi:hypothetical protein